MTPLWALLALVPATCGLQHRPKGNAVDLPGLNSNFTLQLVNKQQADASLEVQNENEMLTASRVGSSSSSDSAADTSTPDWVFAVQSVAVATFITGLGFHFYYYWSPAVLCFAIAFFLDILVTHVATWTGHSSDFSYELYRTLALLAFRSVLIYLVIPKVTRTQVILLGAWNFFDVTATLLMFMACDYNNDVSYESKSAHHLAPLKFVYGNPEAKFALEYGVMFFLVATYELTMNGDVSLKNGDFVGLGDNNRGGSIYSKLKGVLLVVTIISAALFLWQGANNAMMLAEGIGFFTGPWKNEVCNG